VSLVKKLVLYAILIFAVCFGYQTMTGKSITTLPGEISQKLNGPQQKQSTNPRFYPDPEKRLPSDN
jgi:hypothetical protein